MTRENSRNPGNFLTAAGIIPAALLGGVFFIWFAFFALPAPLFPGFYSRVIFDRDGGLLSAGIAGDGQWRFPPEDRIPEKFITALVLYEDKRFFSHNGIDLPAIARAVRLNLSRGEIVSGASTLTMQVMRLQRSGRPRTYREKILEMLLAMRLTVEYDKKEVLRLFASHAPFGGNVVGLEAAAWRYFGRPPERLGWADAALLAVLPNSPGLIHPGRNRDELLRKRNRLLIRLSEEGFISREDLVLFTGEPVPPAPLPLPRQAPHLLERLTGNNEGIQENTGSVVTTLDGRLQERVNILAEEYWRDLQRVGIDNLGILVIETLSGKTAAYAGNGPLEKTANSYVDMVTAKRSTGSLLKPFLYAGMIDSGDLMPRQLVLDIPTRMGTYMPENPTRRYLGAVRADEALARSLNVPAARLLREFGIGRFYNLLEETGMNTLFRSADGYGVSLVLGGAEGTLENLTGMYAGLGRMVLADSAESAFFQPLYLRDTAPGELFDSPFHPGSASLVLKALEDVVRPEEETGWRNFSSSERVSWKTGTSYGFRDGWAVGVTPGYTAGVWVGNSSGEGNAEIQGTKTAAPLLFRVLELLNNGASGSFPVPSGMVRVTVCSRSGCPAGPDCPETETILMPPGAAWKKTCPYHKLVHLDPSGSFRVTSDQVPAHLIKQESWFVLPPVAEWYYSRWNINYAPLPPRMDEGREEVNPMDMPFPTENDEFYIPVDLDGRPGRVVFEVFHREKEKTVFWHLDDEYLGRTADLHQWELRPKKGPHILTLIDEDGALLSRNFTVLSD